MKTRRGGMTSRRPLALESPHPPGRLRFPVILFAVLFLQISSFALRYRDITFPSYTVQNAVQYGNNSVLLADVYSPTGDTARLRPLVIFVHGGGFVGGGRGLSQFSGIIFDALVRRGYVVASIDYRLTPGITNDDPSYFEAMLRAIQDTKAAIRYFRRNPSVYGIDSSQIFVIGSSAGAITSIHAAYLDSSECPSYVRWGNVGNTFEGTSGNPGYSSRVSGVINCWGAIGDTAWIRPGNVPIYNVHGMADSTIFYYKIPAYHSFRFSSKYIYENVMRKNIRTGLDSFPNTGHTLDNNATKQNQAMVGVAAWLYPLLNSSATALFDGFMPGWKPGIFESSFGVYDLAGRFRARRKDLGQHSPMERGFSW